MSVVKLSRISIETLEKLDKFLGVALRIPGLFMIDSYWRTKFVDQTQSSPTSLRWHQFVQYFALINGLLLLILPLNNLKRYYLHVINCLLLLASFYLTYILTSCDSNRKLLTSVFLLFLSNDKVHEWIHYLDQDNRFRFSLFILHIVFDFFLFSLLQASSRMLAFNAIIYGILIILFYLEVFSNMFQILSCVSCLLFCLSFIGYSIKYMIILVDETKTCMFAIRTQGFRPLCIKLTKKIFVPVHFLIFWSITFLVKLYLQSMSPVESSEQTNWMQILLRSICNIYITPITIVSTSVTVTYLSCFVLTIFKLYLWGSIPNAIEHTGTDQRGHNGLEEGVTTLMLTSLTYLTNMNENARMAVMCIISLVVISSLLHSMLEISEPAILSLNNSHNTNRVHHAKIFLLCAFLFGLPVYITYVLMQMFPINFWIAVVFSTCILVSIKVLDLFFVHCLFWWDSCQAEPFEYLDEFVYYSRSVTKVLEFIISISVLVVGIWEAADNRSSVIHGVILLLHYYFNVYQRLIGGLKSYRQRCDASTIVNTLAHASDERIASFNDICSICFLDMAANSKLIVITTKCNHLFHRLCIKRWLCFHNRCPLCVATISVDNNKADDEKID